VPDGEGSDWDIWTGKPWIGGRRFEMTVGLWTHQTTHGQLLTFSKAKTLALMSRTYALRVDPSWLPPGSRVTFTWAADSLPGDRP
jgi:hypothetical protein